MQSTRDAGARLADDREQYQRGTQQRIDRAGRRRRCVRDAAQKMRP